MLARNEVIFKWSLYAAATALCFLLQGALFQRVTVWGVIPFVYPRLTAIPATYEAPAPAAVFALCVGVVCDALLPGAIPCFYTLVFPVIGLCASLLAQRVLPAGFFCSLAATLMAFCLTDLFRCFLLWVTGRGAWKAGLFLLLRELCITLPLSIPLTFLYRAVARKVHMYDCSPLFPNRRAHERFPNPTPAGTGGLSGSRAAALPGRAVQHPGAAA